MKDLSVIERTYECIKWYVPIVEKLPRNYRFTIGERLISRFYAFLEGLIEAKYASQKLNKLQQLNVELDILRYHTRLLLDFQLISLDRYHYAIKFLDTIGQELGGWIKSKKGGITV